MDRNISDRNIFAGAIMRDETHMQSVERWAQYVKKNKGWKKIHTKFINAQIGKAYQAIDKISKLPNGKEKIKKCTKSVTKKNIENYLKNFQHSQKNKTILLSTT